MTVMSTIPELYTINFEEAPSGFDQLGTLYSPQIAVLDDGLDGDFFSHPQIIVGLSVDTGKASLAVEQGDGMWADSSIPSDWGVLDELWGRDNWVTWLAEWESKKKEELSTVED